MEATKNIQNSSNIKYRNDIDGIRFFSCLLVILFHLGIKGFDNGWVGVDIFFVISGFLITQIIIKETSSNSKWLMEFYLRRSRRIIPHCLVVLLAAWIPAYLYLYPTPMISFAKSVLASEFFLSNFLFFYESGYFDPISKSKPLLHTWSIALEWQFYLFYPIVLIILNRLVSGIFALKLLVMSIMSFIIGLMLWEYASGAAFYLLPGRAWEFMMGGVLAVMPQRFFYTKYNIYFASMGVTLLVISVYWIQDATNLRHPGFFTLLPVFGSMLLIAFAPSTIFEKILSIRSIVFLGKLSFGAYLWHYLLIKFTEIGFQIDSISSFSVIIIFFSFFLSWLVFISVENPIRYKVTNKSFFSLMFISISLLIILSSYAMTTKGNMNRFETPKAILDGLEVMPNRENGFCFYSVGVFSNPVSKLSGINCKLDRTRNQEEYNLLHFGDSFAGSYDPFLEMVGEKIGANINSVSTNYCFAQFNDDFPGRATSKGYSQCMINREFLIDEIENFDGLILSGHWALIHEKEQLLKFIEFINQISIKNKVIIMLSPPLYEQQDLSRRIWDSKTKLRFSERDVTRRIANKILIKELNSNSSILFLDPSSNYLNDMCISDCYPISSDGEHLSIYGSYEIGKYFLDQNHDSLIENFLKKKS